MEKEQVTDFVNTINSIKENFCTFDGNLLTVTTIDEGDPVNIELSDIESIELTRNKFTGTEILIRSLSGNHILAYTFANKWEEVLFDIENIFLGFYYKYFWNAICFLSGSALTALFFVLK